LFSPHQIALANYKDVNVSVYGWFEKSGERSLSPLIAIYDNWLINYFQKMGGTPSANINYPREHVGGKCCFLLFVVVRFWE
jgi:hypothetical protein